MPSTVEIRAFSRAAEEEFRLICKTKQAKPGDGALISLSLSLLFRPRPPTVPGNGLDNSDALKALSTAVASATGKPESYVLVSLRTDVALSFGGSEAPAAFGDLLSIGAVGGAKNKTISKAVSDVVTAKLGVPSSRFYLSITDMKGSDFGWTGGTF